MRSKEEYIQILIKKKGQKWVEKHIALLDEQYEYIKSLGEPEDVPNSFQSPVNPEE